MIPLLAVFLLPFAIGPALRAEDAPRSSRRALIVAINSYKWSGAVHSDPDQDFSNLGGAVNDGKWLKSILATRYGFRDEDVLLLTDERATRQAIIDGFRNHLIAKSRPGDAALFYFAGHGSRNSSASGSDETILSADARDPDGKVFDLTTSELHVLFSALLQKTGNITSILDSCHSGTAVRDAQVSSVRTRFAPSDRRARPAESYLKMRSIRGVTPQAEPLSRIIAVAAARADQLAIEYTDGAGPEAVQHGLMSFALFTELQKARDGTTWRDVMDRVRARVAVVNAAQETQLETDLPNTLIFGGIGAGATESYFLVTPRHTNVELNGGAIQGLTEGAGLDVYSPGERDFTREPIAKLTVMNLNEFTAQANVVASLEARKIPAGARAVVRFRPEGAFKLKILFQGTGQVLDQIRARVERAAWAALVGDPTQADVAVSANGDSIRMERPAGLTLSPPVLVSQSGAAELVAQRLEKWARWHEFLRMEGGTPVLSLSLSEAHETHPATVHERDPVTLQVCNTGTRQYFVSIVDFSSDGSMTPVPMLTEGAALALDAGMCKSRSFYASLPEGRNSIVDVFKAFATVENVDFGAISAGAIRASLPDNARWSATLLSLAISRN